jgi:hypothetical protein
MSESMICELPKAGAGSGIDPPQQVPCKAGSPSAMVKCRHRIHVSLLDRRKPEWKMDRAGNPYHLLGQRPVGAA